MPVEEKLIALTNQEGEAELVVGWRPAVEKRNLQCFDLNSLVILF